MGVKTQVTDTKTSKDRLQMSPAELKRLRSAVENIATGDSEGFIFVVEKDGKEGKGIVYSNGVKPIDAASILIDSLKGSVLKK